MSGPALVRYVVETIDDRGRIGARSWLLGVEAAEAYVQALTRRHISYEFYRLEPAEVRQGSLL